MLFRSPEYIIATENEILTMRVWAMAEGEPIQQPPPRQRDLVKAVHQANADALEHMLSHDPTGKAWLLSSAYKGSLHQLKYACCGTVKLTAEAIRFALAQRLLLPDSRVNNFQRVRCSQCSRLGDPEHHEDELDPRFHGLNCPNTQGIRNTRHNFVRNELHSLLVRLFGRANVILEPGNLGGGDAQPDILLQLPGGGQQLLIDVCIVNPACGTYVLHRSAEEAGSAARHREQIKRRRYQDTLAALNLPPECFVPFVLEATGRWGPAAETFLKNLPLMGLDPNVTEAESITAFCSRRIQGIIGIGNAKCMAACTMHMVRRHQHPTPDPDPDQQPTHHSQEAIGHDDSITLTHGQEPNGVGDHSAAPASLPSVPQRRLMVTAEV